MVQRSSQRRAYSSILRGEQQELTRSRIMKAVADLIRDGLIHSFTVEEVAQRAVVSYGSVYRHFPTKERLLEEVYEWFQQGGNAPSLPDSLDAIPPFAETLMAFLEANADLAHAGVIAMTALGVVPKTQREHDLEIRTLVAEADPSLDPQQVRVKAAVIRYIASSLAWATLRQRFELDPGEISSALSWALGTLIREVGNRGAGRNDGPQK